MHWLFKIKQFLKTIFNIDLHKLIINQMLVIVSGPGGQKSEMKTGELTYETISYKLHNDARIRGAADVIE